MRKPLTESEMNICKTLRLVRETLGWTRHRLGMETGIPVHSVEAYDEGRAPAPTTMIARTEEATGFPIAAMAWHLFGDASSLPPEIQDMHQKFKREWERQLSLMRKIKHMLPGAW